MYVVAKASGCQIMEASTRIPPIAIMIGTVQRIKTLVSMLIVDMAPKVLIIMGQTNTWAAAVVLNASDNQVGALLSLWLNGF